MENLDLVHQKSSDSQSLTHSRPAECFSRSVLVVSPSGGLPSNICSKWHWPQIDLWATGSTTSCLCISSTRFPDHSSGCTKSAMGGSGCICLPTSDHLGQSGGEVVGLPMQKNHSDCSGLAQHALVLGLSDHVESDPTEPGLLAQPVNTVFNQIPHRNLTSLNLHAWLLEPHHSRSRVFLMQWHKN